MARKHIIVGTGPAGLTALEKIRSITPEDKVTLVSREACLPYSPTALPYLLSGQIETSKLWVADGDYFERMACDFHSGKEVVRVVAAKKEVVYKGGEREKYDTLLICTGSKPVRPSVEGIEEVGFLGFHTLEDYHELIGRLEGKRDVLLYGGGLVTMGLASGLVKRGLNVKIIVRSRILRSYFNTGAGTIISEGFIARGAEIITGSEISQVRKLENGVEAGLTDGRRFPGDLLICCLGTVPRISFLEGSGIEIKKGIVVDRKMETNIEGIYAAGDVTEAPGFFGQPGLNAIVPNAVAQGEIAGSNMAGEKRLFKGWIPMNVFNFFDNSACSVGYCLADEEDTEILEDVGGGEKNAKRLVFKNDKLIGAMFVNEDVDPGVIRYLIEEGIDMKQHKDLLFSKTRDAGRWLMLEAEKSQARSLDN